MKENICIKCNCETEEEVLDRYDNFCYDCITEIHHYFNDLCYNLDLHNNMYNLNKFIEFIQEIN